MDIKARLDELKTLINRYQNSYYKTGKSEVPDVEYDRLFDELLSIESQYPELVTSDSPSKRVGSDLTQDFPEVRHAIPVLSLDKAYSPEEIYSFIKRIKNESNSEDLCFVLEEKIDGFSIVLYYEDGVLVRAVTRGNGYIGNDVTDNVKTIKMVPLRLTEKVNIAVRGEVFLFKEDFKKINSELDEGFANPRNLASGTIRRIKSSETAKVPLSIFCYEGFLSSNSGLISNSNPYPNSGLISNPNPYPNSGLNSNSNPYLNSGLISNPSSSSDINIDADADKDTDTDKGTDTGTYLNKTFSSHLEILEYLKKLGFNVDKNISVFTNKDLDEIPNEIKRRAEIRESLPYEIDGLVLKVNDIKLREKLGFTEHHPRWAIAYKFQPPQAETQVLNIDVQVGRTGRITPMARIKSVSISGSEIKNATLHNQDYINQLELCIGDTVAVSKRGDVIPAVEYVIEKNDMGNTIWQMPKYCPVCGSVLVTKGAHLFCPNTSCKAREIGALIYFCSKKQMDIQGLGEKVLTLLYEKGYVKNITDIYTFSPSKLLEDEVEGFGEKKVKSMEESILESKNQPFRKLLSGLGIEEFSHNAIDLVFNSGVRSYDSFKELVSDTDKAFTKLSSIVGLGPETSKNIVKAFTDPKIIETLNFFKEHGFKMEEEVVVEDVDKDLSLSGQSWCVTGSFEKFKSRELIHDIIKKHGAKVVTSVSGNTTHLLVGENAGSKLNKALSLGVKIVTEAEFLNLLNTIGEDYEEKTLF